MTNDFYKKTNNMNVKLLFLIIIITSLSACEFTTEQGVITVDQIIELGLDITPEQTELTSIERIQFDEQIETVTDGLIFKYTGLTNDSLNTTIAIPLSNLNNELSVSSSTKLVCKKIQGCTGFCAIDRWMQCDCISSANGNCASVNEEHDFTPGNLLASSVGSSIYP